MRGAVAMEMKCLYFSCKMVTFSPEDSGFEARNWAKPSLRSAEKTTTCDPKGCCDLSLWSNVLLVVAKEARSLSVQSNLCGAARISNMEDHTTVNREGYTHRRSGYSKQRKSEVRG